MKKAGILTIFGEYNYGNRLQNYAVQHVLKDMGLDVETIKYNALDVTVHNTNEKRLKFFKNFNENIKFHRNEINMNDNNIPESVHEFDHIVIGSDQIWNFTFEKLFSSKVFADFIPDYKRISFSASFGVDYLPKDEEIYNVCKECLNELKAISVREDAGKRIVEELTGRKDAVVLIDPTMMLDSTDWEKLMKRPEQLKTDKFILKVFLGSSAEEEELNRIAKENNCEIIDITDKKSPYYEIGPSEFLYLEKNAFLVVTDSFHSCVFATLFSTPFVVFQRNDDLESMNSRIETLLSKFEMENRLCTNKITSEMLNNDYSRQFEILKEERLKVKEFLNNAIG